MTVGNRRPAEEPDVAKAILKVQEDEYVFPYHFIPFAEDGAFAQTRHWSWGIHYLGGIQTVQNILSKKRFTSLIDIGCGDGRFLHDMSRKKSNIDWAGVDFSERSISFARAFSPNVDFNVRDIVSNPTEKQYDVATLIEVIEHIEPSKLKQFLGAVAQCIQPGGTVIITVPHKNSPLIDKHFQHFDADSLRSALEDHFIVTDIGFFDRSKSILLKLAKTFLGGGGKQFVITNSFLNRAFYRMYRKNCLHVASEKNCQRLVATATRPLAEG